MAHREFTDADGLLWSVWNVRPSLRTDGSSVPGTLLSEEAAGGWLAFQCPGHRRRFYMPPEDWDSLSNAQLAKLCHHAVRVPTAAPLPGRATTGPFSG